MNMRMLGIILIVLAILMFGYKGITYKTHKKVLDLGPLEVTQEKTENFPFSPVLGGVALLGGIALVVGYSGKRAV